MLDDNPNDTSDDTAGSSTPGEAAAPPTVTRTTRKTAARKTAASGTRARKAAATADAPATGAPPADGPGEAAPAPVVKKTTRTRTPRKTAAEAPAAPETVDAAAGPQDAAGDAPPAKKAATRKTTRTRKTAATTDGPAAATDSSDAPADRAVDHAGTAAPRKTTARRSTAKKAAATKAAPAEPVVDPAAATAPEPEESAEPVKAARKTAKKAGSRSGGGRKAAAADAPAVDAPTADQQDEGAAAGGIAPLFQAPDASAVTRRTRRSPAARKAAAAPADEVDGETLDLESPVAETPDATADETQTDLTADELAQDGTDQDVEGSEDADGQSDEETAEDNGPARRRRRRGGRRRRKGGDGSGPDAAADTDGEGEDEGQDDAEASSDDTAGDSAEQGEGTSRRRRRRRRAGEEGGEDSTDEPNTVTRVRSRRSAEDQITAVAGSTRLEAKKQRRREGREAGRRRAPIVSEAEFLARRESVDRTMVIRQREDLTQIAVLEDKVLVEHYVARESQTSLIGNVYLGRVQNVLPSMEAAFIDIGRGRNAVLYAGEVNWASLGHKEGQPRKIESVLSSGQSILVQVTKDPIGHKGARLTSQVSLAGRFLVYVPDGTTSGISRKLPDTERNRLKTLLKEIVPDSAGVIVRTAAEGASEDELTRDVERLKARWEDIEAKARGNAPALLYGEPDLTLKVVRDLFTEDFNTMVIQGDDAWETVQAYVEHVAPDLVDRVQRFESPDGASAKKSDIFAVHRIDEQISKGLDRKVWLPSGGSLVIDRTEAMTVVDVNTGKFTGSGGNLEETVTKNNLEAAEEIVRQLRLRDIGGIIVVDFIDMVLESNRDLVVRRLVECLGRDRTRHQVAEVTSLGLVQMTRKRIGTGLVEAFSRDCEHCQGRGVVIQAEPVEAGRNDDDDPQRSGRRGRGRGRGDGNGSGQSSAPQPSAPSPKDVAAMARADRAEEERAAEAQATGTAGEGTPDGEATQPARSAEPAPDTRSTESSGRREGSRRGGRSGGRSRTAPAEDTAPSEDTASVELAAVDNARAASSVEPGTAVLVDAPSSTEQAAQLVGGTPPVEPAGDGPAEPVEPAVVAPVEQEGPRVVTRTRRRAASRPAGPPVGVAGTQPVSGLVEPGTSAVEPGGAPVVVPDPSDTAHDEPHVEHVPIKKKGTRKR